MYSTLPETFYIDLEEDIMNAVFHTVGVFLVLLLATQVVRKSKWIAVALYGVLTIVLSFTLIRQNGTAEGSTVNTWFTWAKLYSVIAGCLLITYINYTKNGLRKLTQWLVFAILAVNILEAVGRDLEIFIRGDAFAVFGYGQAPAETAKFGIYHLLNALAGLLNIIALSGWESMEVKSNGSGKDLLWRDLRPFWIGSYTIWNFAYIYNCVPAHAGYGIAVLAAAFVAGLFLNEGTWLQARAYTLGLWMLYVMSFTSLVDAPGNFIALPYNGVALTVVSSVSFILNLVFAWLAIKQRQSRFLPWPKKIWE